jgi:hypothetical protein
LQQAPDQDDELGGAVEERLVNALADPPQAEVCAAAADRFPQPRRGPHRVLGVTLMDGVRDREEDPFREPKPIRQCRHEADNHGGANERPGDAFDVGASLLDLQHQPDDTDKEYDQPQRVGQGENTLPQSWSEVFHQLRLSCGRWRNSSCRSFSMSRAFAAGVRGVFGPGVGLDRPLPDVHRLGRLLLRRHGEIGNRRHGHGGPPGMANREQPGQGERDHDCENDEVHPLHGRA